MRDGKGNEGGGLESRSANEVTRLAPSPTGALHLGNARTFLVNWALARRGGWRVVLRIEDLVGPRVKPGLTERTIETLRWLGMEWDEGPAIQSADLEPYREAMRALARGGMVYPSELTRGQIEAAAAAPQEGVSESVFPAELRPAARPRVFEGTSAPSPTAGSGGVCENWRFVVEPGAVEFEDGFAGRQVSDPARSVGDFVVWTKMGQPAYQLAVVVDDHRQGVTQVVRGNDLVDSAARQLLLYRALGYAPEPAYTHISLVRGPDGRRLAKRHGDTRVDRYREMGVPVERVMGLMGAWCGLVDRPAAMTAGEFVRGLELSKMPGTDVTFRPEDDAWLLGGR